MTAETINKNIIETQETNPTFFQRVSQFFQRVPHSLLGLLLPKQPECVREYTLQRYMTINGQLVPQGEPETHQIK